MVSSERNVAVAVSAAAATATAAAYYAYGQYSKRYPRYQEQVVLFNEVSVLVPPSLRWSLYIWLLASLSLQTDYVYNMV